MGTRSLTVFVDNSHDKPKELGVLYRQFDGYPSGHGADLANFLDQFILKNGYAGTEKWDEKVANGPECLWAQIVSYFKVQFQKEQAQRLIRKPEQNTTIGNFYLHAAGTRDYGEEWIYTIYYNGTSTGGLFEDKLKKSPLTIEVVNIYTDQKDKFEIYHNDGVLFIPSTHMEKVEDEFRRCGNV